MDARPCVGWLFDSSFPVATSVGSPADAENGAGSFTFSVTHNFSGRNSHHSTTSTGTAPISKIHLYFFIQFIFFSRAQKKRVTESHRCSDPPSCCSLELLQRRGAEIRVEALAVDRYGLEL